MKLYLGTDPENCELKDLVHYPIIKTIPLEIPSHMWEDFAEYTHILITSKNGAAIFLSQLKEVVAKLPASEKSMILSQFVEAAVRPEPHCGAHTQKSRAPQWGDKMAQKGDFAGAGSFATTSKDKETLKNKKIIAIGKSTAVKLTGEGFAPHLIAEDESQEGVIELLKRQDLHDAYIFYPRSSLARKKLESYMIARGIRHQICDLYETVFQKPEPFPDFAKIDEIIFTSPSTVKGFIAAFGAIPSNKKLTCIGPITEEELKKSL